jgi:putative cell wall-binding protein
MIGEGAASAALDGSTVAAVTSVNYLAGSATAATLPSYVVTVPSTDTVTSGDYITLVFTPTGGCTSTSYVTIGGTITATQTGPVTPATLGATTSTSAGCIGVNTVKIAASSTASAAGGTITISGLTLTSPAGAAAGSVAVAASFVDSTNTVGTLTFPSPATIGRFTVTGPNPAPNLKASSTLNSVGNISITEPFVAATPVNYVCVALSSGTFAAAPTVTATSGSGAATLGATVTNNSTSVSFQVTAASSTIPTTFTLSGISINAPSVAGGNSLITVTSNTLANCSGTSTALPSTTAVAFSAISATQTYYGQTADATTAVEFENTYSPGCTEGGGSVVLTTDADPYDALAASYLAGELGTGILITPVTGLGSDAVLAMRLMGVTNVYVVGGPLAVPASVTSAITALPVYSCGGVTQTGKTVTIANNGASIYGQTADDTAKAINTFYPATVVGSLTTISGAYNATGGKYNDTYTQYGGTGSATAPTNLKTAFLVSDTDYSDAAALAPIAYRMHIPVILTPTSGLGTQASSTLTALGIGQCIVVGGPLAVPNAIVTSIQGMSIAVLRVAGLDASDTATQVANLETGLTASNLGLGWVGGTGIILASGPTGNPLAWGDILGIAAYAANNTDPVLFTEGPAAGLGTYTTAELNQAGNAASTPPGLGGHLYTGLWVVGGPSAVTASEVAAAQSAIAAG